MNSTYLERLATGIAQKQGIDLQEDEVMRFDAPKQGHTFNDGPYTLHIPKSPRFAPYVVTLHRLTEVFNRAYYADPIALSNGKNEFEITFTPWQFASAFGGVYHPKTIARQLDALVDKIDDVSTAVVRRIERIPEEFLCTRYVIEVGAPWSRTIVSDEQAMNTLAENIPRKYKHARAKRGIRALTKKELLWVPLKGELSHRFKENKMKFIVLKGFDHRDRFPDDAMKIVVEERQLALTFNYNDSRSPKIPPAFDHQTLWKGTGEDLALAYALITIPKNIIRERLKWYDTPSEVLSILRGTGKE